MPSIHTPVQTPAPAPVRMKGEPDLSAYTFKDFLGEFEHKVE
jgi:hypothetical protein